MVTFGWVTVLVWYLQDPGGGGVSSSGDALLVDLLETQVESLKAKLEQTQVSLVVV